MGITKTPASRNVEFFVPLQDNAEDGLRGFEVKDADGYLLLFGPFSYKQKIDSCHQVNY